MTTPKILPWLAHAAGVNDRRAETLWRTACLRAALTTCEQDSSRYWGAAKRQLLVLLACERRRSQSLAWLWLPIQAALDSWFALANGYCAALDAVVLDWSEGTSGGCQARRARPPASRDEAGSRGLLPHFASFTPGIKG